MPKTVIYDNCQCLSQKGQHMFYCDRKRANNYLKKGIAKVITEEPLVFQLLFEPKGVGVPHQSPKENKCLICGTEEDLARHHVIPYSFRKMMTNDMKDRRSEDIVPLCEQHHREYETSSRELTLKLMENCKEELANRSLAIRAKKASFALTNYYDHLSDEAKSKFTSLLKYLNYEIRTDSQILMKKLGQKKIAALWKKDFIQWIERKGIQNFKFKK